MATGRYTADSVEQDLTTALSEIQQALDKMHGTGTPGAGAASVGAASTGTASGAQGQQVSAQDVQALDFWMDLGSTLLKAAPLLISLLQTDQGTQGGAQQQQVQLQGVTQQDLQSVVTSVIKMIPTFISMFSVKLQQVGPQNVTAQGWNWGEFATNLLKAAPAIISLFQVEQGAQGGAQQQQVQLQEVTAQDWTDVASGIINLIPIAISLFQVQVEASGQGGVGGASVAQVGAQATPSTPQAQNLAIQ